MVGNELSRLFVVIGAKTSGFNKGMDGVSNKMQNVSKKMKIAGGIMVAAIAAIGAASLKMAVDFDKGMREVNTLINLTEKEFGDFSKEVLQLSKAMGVNAVDATHALYQAISAGVPKENAIDFLTIASKAAIGGVTDVTTAVNGLVVVMNAFKIPMSEAEHVSDVLFKTVKGGITTFPELAASMFNVAPIAAAAGVKFEEVAAALASITKQGVPTAVATTQLRAAIQAVAAPTIRQKKMIEELGIELNAATLQTLGLAGAFNMMIEATDGDMQMMRRLVGSVEAVQAILALTGQNAEVFAADLESMGDAAGAAQKAFEEMEKSPAVQMAKLKANLQYVGITIGTALIPALLKIVRTLTPIIEKVGDWISRHGNLTVAILAGVAALGLLLVAGGILLPLLSTAIASLKLVAIAQWAWNAAMAANPIGLIVAGIGILVIAIAGISGAWKDTTKTMREQLEEQTRLVQEAVDKQRQAILGTTNAKLDALQKERDAASEGNQQRQLDAQKEAALEETLTDDQIEKMKEAGATQEEIDKEVADSQKGLIDWMYAAYDKQLNNQMEAARKEGDSLIAALEEKAKHWKLLTEAALGYLDTIQSIHMTEWQLFPAAPPQFGTYFHETGAPTYGNIIKPFAAGGLITKPTLAMLGEQGPEMVIPLSGESPQAGITNTFHISGMVVREEADIKRIARELYNLQRINARAAGVA